VRPTGANESTLVPGPVSRVLERSFYARETVIVARELLGCVLRLGPCAGRIVETEAYLGLDDLAAHASRGITGRTRIIFGPPGHAYIYLIYGMYECLNLIAEPEGTPGCVLIRALEPLEGIDHMRARRGAKVRKLEDLANGPGKLTVAMGITRREHLGVDVTKAAADGALVVEAPSAHQATQTNEIVTTTRIGIRRCADWPLRFYLQGNPSVSRT
jgi:DNA-3-methyladenine glycosylase